MQLILPFWVTIAIIALGITSLIFPNKVWPGKINPVYGNNKHLKQLQILNSLLVIFLGSVSLFCILFADRQAALMTMLMCLISYRSLVASIKNFVEKRTLKV